MGCLLVWYKILKISEHESEGHRTEVPVAGNQDG